MNSDIHIITRGTVTSTMSEARSLVSGQELDLPFAVVASGQTDGLGRQGRTWLSDEGAGLYVTFALPLQSTPQSQGLIALAVGVAICDVLVEFGIDPGLKWPNDVVVDERKIAGVLIQSIADEPGTFLIGIGLNLQRAPEGDDTHAVALETLIGELPDTIPLLRKLAGRIGEWLDRYDGGESDFIVDAWIGYAIWLGAEVEVITDSVQRGVFLGVDRNGLLILETPTGEVTISLRRCSARSTTSGLFIYLAIRAASRPPDFSRQDVTLTKTVILGGARTPFGKMGGSLASLTSVDLGGHAIRSALDKSNISADAVDHVIMGQVLQGGVGQIPARQAAFSGGLDRAVTAETINRVCGSGMRAINLADLQIGAGHHDVIVAGGMESMTHAPYFVRNARQGYRMGNGIFEDMMIVDGLFCAVEHVQMGIHGDTVSEELSIAREEQDAWALRSHRRAIAATDDGRFAEEISPITITDRKGSTEVATDEAPRRDTTAEALANLKPAFSPNGSVTAGNAPGVNDGAAALIVTNAAWAVANGLNPLATILGQGEAAWEAPYLAKTPAMASEVALKRAGLTIKDIDLIEINEAFANVAINSARMLGVDPEIVNVNGGAVALGHPIGASGARIVLTLALELRRRGGGIGLAAICSGGGQGDAIIISVEP